MTPKDGQLIVSHEPWMSHHICSKPDGTPRKLLDVSRLTQLGWQPRIGLEAGVRSTYEWFVANNATARG